MDLIRIQQGVNSTSLVPSRTSGHHFILARKVGLVLICRILGCSENKMAAGGVAGNETTTVPPAVQ